MRQALEQTRLHKDERIAHESRNALWWMKHMEVWNEEPSTLKEQRDRERSVEQDRQDHPQSHKLLLLSWSKFHRLMSKGQAVCRSHEEVGARLISMYVVAGKMQSKTRNLDPRFQHIVPV